jgi:tetratricopeptide (TPR) repeat protein
VTATDLAAQVPIEKIKFNAALERSAPVGFRWKFDWMPQEDHMSIPLPSIYRGLETIFEQWRLGDPVSLFDQGGIKAFTGDFERPATDLVVAALMSAGRLDDASKVLLQDTNAYPPPWNQLEALAPSYEKRGDTEQALRFYRLSLERNPGNEFAREKLKAAMDSKTSELRHK